MKLKDLKGTFTATAVIDSDFVLENAAAILASITEQVGEQGGAIEVGDGWACVVGGTQRWRLPSMDRVRSGVVAFRSKDFTFTYTDSLGVEHTSYCDKPKAAAMTDEGFTTLNFSGDVTTWTLEK